MMQDASFFLDQVNNDLLFSLIMFENIFINEIIILKKLENVFALFIIK
jgi:hypothetical protein